MDKELINLLEDAEREIRSLRRQNELMKARLDGFDSALQLLHAYPPAQGEHGMCEDIAWKLNRAAEDPKKNVVVSKPVGEFGIPLGPVGAQGGIGCVGKVGPIGTEGEVITNSSKPVQ